MENGAPLEVATALDQRDSGDRGDGIPPVAHRLIGPHDPSPVCLGDEDRGVAEGLAPLDAHAVKMRMRHRDAAQPTSVPNCGDARIVDKAQAVPEDIAGSGLHQQRPLADSNRWIRADPGQSRFEVADVSTPAFRPKLLERRPTLPLRRHVLTLVVADRAMRRRFRAGRLLHPAGPANVSGHGLNVDSHPDLHLELTGTRPRAKRTAIPRADRNLSISVAPRSGSRVKT